MTGPIRLAEIPLKDIRLDEAAGEAGTAPDQERLAASLEAVGLLNPVWLRTLAGGSYEVVTGARRVAAAARLGWPAVTARLLPASTPDFHCLLVHLFDNAFSRGFNLREQARLAAGLAADCDLATLAARYLPYLGLPPSPAHLTRLLKTASLEEPWLGLAAAGRLAMTAAAQLADWAAGDRAAAWPYFNGLRLSQSKQEEFLEQVVILARREGLTPAAVLGQDQLRQALTDPDRTPPERAEAVRRQLFRQVYPRLSAAREAFAAALGRLGFKGSPRMRLHPPPAFEGPDFHLEIRFRDAPELEKLVQEIAEMARQAEFAGLTRT